MELNPIIAILVVYTIIVIGLVVYYFILFSDGGLDVHEKENIRDIITHFHEDPDFDDFMVVYRARDKLEYRQARQVRFWLWGVYLCYPHFYNAARLKVLKGYMREIERGLKRIKKTPTAELIDCVWGLYFATGDPQYPELVKDIANNCPTFDASTHAVWTYTDIMGKCPRETAPQ